MTMDWVKMIAVTTHALLCDLSMKMQSLRFLSRATTRTASFIRMERLKKPCLALSLLGVLALTVLSNHARATEPPELGLLMSMGRNLYGQLGDGTTIYRLSPVQVGDGVTAVATGGIHSLFLKGDGSLWAAGYNARGQLGDGTTTNRPSPILVDTGVAKIEAGGSHSLYIKSDGTLWGMGYNSNGQLGDGTTTNRLSPFQISSEVVEVSGGSDHTLFVKADGTLWGMGYNVYRQLGDGTGISRLSPVPIASQVAKVSSGSSHSLFLKTDGSVWGMGGNNAGQLGDGTTTTQTVPVQVATNVVKMEAGNQCSFFLKTDGTLWGTGSNSAGKLGDGTSTNHLVPFEIASDVTDVAAGQNSLHTLFLKTDGALWGMGANSWGQLGIGTTVSSNVPVLIAKGVTRMAAGQEHSLFLQDRGRLTLELLPVPVGAAGATWSVTGGALTYSSGQTVSLPAGPHAVTFSAVESYTAPAPMSVQVLAGQAISASATYTGGPAPALTMAIDGLEITPTTPPTTFQNSLSSPSTTRQFTLSNTGNVTISGLVVRFDGSGAYPFSVSPTSPFALVPGQSANLDVIFSGPTFGGDFPASLVVSGTGLPDVLSVPLVGLGVPRQGSVQVTLEPAAARDAGAQWSADNGLTWHPSGASISLPAGAHDILFSSVSSYRAPRSVSLQIPPDGSVSRSASYTRPAFPRMMVAGANLYGELGIYAPPFPGFLASVKQVASAIDHAFVLGSDGTLWGSGTNSGSVFGLGPDYTFHSAVEISSGVDWVAAGWAHTLFVKTDGTLWGMGANSAGQLGSAPLIERSYPILIDSSVVQAAAGGAHSLFIKTDGSLWAMGDNTVGQLGIGSTIFRSAVPALIATGVRQVAAGEGHNLFVKTDGSLWAMGSNNYGKLGDGTTTLQRSPILIAQGVVQAAASEHHSFFIRDNGTLWAVGRNNLGQLGTGNTNDVPVPVQVSSGVAHVSTSMTHSLFVKNDGSLWAMGDNSEGQLGDRTGTARLTPVKVAEGVSVGEAGYDYSLFIKTDGTYFAAGTGSTTIGTELTYPVTPGATFQATSTPVEAESNVIEVAAAESRSLFIKADGTLWTSGGSSGYVRIPRLVAADVKAVAAGREHDLFIKTDNSLWAVGNNSYGQLGDGTLTSRSEPVQIATDVSKIAAGSRHSLFVKLDGSLWSMGANSSGELGDGSTTLRKTPVQIVQGVSAITAGSFRSMFIKTDGTLWAMGTNSYGNLGLGALVSSAVPIQIATNVSQVVAGIGGAHTHFVKQDGSLWAMGNNSLGALGEGPATSILSPIKVATDVALVASGGDHSLFIKTDGSLWATGTNNSGELGDGSTTIRFAPVKVAENVVKIAQGSRHSLFIVSDRVTRLAVGCDSVFARAAGARWSPDGGITWYDNDAMPALSPGNYTIHFSAVAGYLTPAPMTVQLLEEQIHRVRVNYQRAKDGALRQLMVMGANDHGQLGIGTIQPVGPEGILKVASSSSHSLMVKKDGSLWAMGQNSTGQLGDGTTVNRTSAVQVFPSGILSVAAGGQFSLVLTVDGHLWAMGRNDEGQVGDGTYTTKTVPVHVASDVIEIAAGSAHSLFIKSDGSLWAMGSGTSGQLGDGISGSGSKRNIPFQVTSGVRDVAAGGSHSLFVKTDGSLWAMGSNALGQLGDGTTTARVTPVQISSGVSRVYAGGSTSFYVKDNQLVYAMGYNEYGQLGKGNSSSAGISEPERALKNVTGQVVDIAPSHQHTLFLMADGRLITVGRNLKGQLGNGVSTDVVRALAEPSEVAAGVSSIAAANEHSLLVKLDGTLWGMGSSSNGLLGAIHTAPMRIADGIATVAAGGSHSLFLDKDSRLWGSGTATEGQLGYDPFELLINPFEVTEDQWTPRMTAKGRWAGMAKLSTASSHSLLVTEDGTLWSMGYNSFGQLGDGTTYKSSGDMRVAASVIEVAAGYYHCLYLQKNGSLWAMGRNDQGQLGDGTFTDRLMAVQVADQVTQISAGGSHSLFIKADGGLWVMGGNSRGQLGNGTTTSAAAPFQIATHVASVAAGDLHSLFVKLDGTLWGMGDNLEGQLSDGATTLGSLVTSPVLLAAGITKSSGGRAHTLYSKTDGTLWGMGKNNAGQVTGASTSSLLAPVQIAQQVVDFDAGDSHSMFISNDPAYQVPAPPIDRFLAFVSDAGLVGENAGPLSIPYSDGVPNLLKYAFNLQMSGADSTPLQAGSSNKGLPAVSVQRDAGSGILRIEFLRRKDSGLIYQATVSTSLQSSSFVPMNGNVQVTPIDLLWERVSAEQPFDPAQFPRLFGRVEVGVSPR